MPINRSFYFIRHGQTDWNAEGRLQGHTDIPLNDKGREQARAAISFFKGLKIDLIFSSPLGCAYETAKIIGGGIGAPVKKHDGLKERHFGSNEGRLVREIKAEYVANPKMEILMEKSDFPHAIDSESYYVLENRLVQAVDEVVKNSQGNILIAGHGAVFSALNGGVSSNDDQVYARCSNATPYHFEKINDWTWNVEKVEL